MQGRTLIVFLAMTMALSALGIDLLLPAFPDIRADFGLPPGSTLASRFITAYFVGLAGGQLLIGPLSDRYGRRVLLRSGIVLYMVGAALTIVAPSFTTLLVARFVWGLGGAAGRVITVAIVRDRLVGAAMARTISTIMAVFITVPVVAPALGTLLLRVLRWDQLVLVNLLGAALVLLWSSRLEETLPPDERRTLRLRELRDAGAFVLRHPSSGPLVLTQAVLFGGFASYLSTSEVVYRDVFGQGERFPVLFGGMALLMGLASLVNSRVVERVGLDRAMRRQLGGYLTGAVLLVTAAWVTDGVPPLAVYVGVLAVLLTSHATLIPNLNARAMEPMGAIAGTASAINGTTLVGGGALLGAVFDRAYDGTVLPLATALLAVGVVTALLLLRAGVLLSGRAGPSPARRSFRRPAGRPADRHGPS